MTYTISELIPDNSRKSFYGKAKVISFPDGMTALISYNTVVAYTDAEGNLHRVWKKGKKDWSATTGRHISAYARAYTKSGNTIGKAIWDKMAIDTIPDREEAAKAEEIAYCNTYPTSNLYF